MYFINNKTIKIMEITEKVLNTLKEAGEPLNAGNITEISG